jgi:glutamate-1-semialdehyde 2,1-aminomutase
MSLSRYPMSDKWHAKAIERTPSGSQTMSKARSRYGSAHPAFLEAGIGAWVTDVDGLTYCDWSCGLAAITLGYQHPAVNDAVVTQLTKGVSFSLPTRLEAMVAEQLCDVFPCGQNGMVRFTKTGSEADSAACRIARRATGNVVILASGYLGWHDWALSRNALHPGIPREDNVYSFPYNDVACVDGLLRTHKPDVAAVFIEPVLFDEPKPGFLHDLRRLCDDHGVLLIFDEVVCGGRWALGGAQEYFGVMPDLCTFGKGLANGYPLAGIVGRKDLMQYADTISGTFGGEALSLAACQATLAVYRKEEVVAHMWSIGKILVGQLAEAMYKYDLAGVVSLEGYPVHPRLKFHVQHANACMTLVLQELARYGVLIHPGGWNVSLAHDMDEVRHTAAAFDIAFEVLANALKEGFAPYLAGTLIEPSPFQRAGPDR